jgi:PAS domain S-box-containing protein
VRPAGEAPQPVLAASQVLDQVAAGIVVVDRDCGLLYANAFAVMLFGFPDGSAHLAGRPLLSLGIEESDAPTVQHMADNVLRGWPWEGTFASQRLDGSRVFLRAHAAPLRAPHGEITGIVITAREATRRGSQRLSDRIGLLERIGERLASSLELDVTLRQVAETLVPQFADHCLIDLLHGDSLVRRAQLHSRGWMPEPGTWALVGEPISYPKGHFCELAMSRQDTVIVADLGEQRFPAPTPESMQVSEDVKMTSVMAAPLIARGQLLGVMSLALSWLTAREERHYGADDRDFLSAIASRVAIAIDNSLLFEEERRTALAFQTSLLPKDPPFVDGLEVAYKYVPAKPLETHGQGIQTQVGGDWYDIIPLSWASCGRPCGPLPRTTNRRPRSCAGSTTGSARSARPPPRPRASRLTRRR